MDGWTGGISLRSINALRNVEVAISKIGVNARDVCLRARFNPSVICKASSFGIHSPLLNAKRHSVPAGIVSEKSSRAMTRHDLPGFEWVPRFARKSLLASVFALDDIITVFLVFVKNWGCHNP